MADQKTSIIIHAVDNTHAAINSATLSLKGLATAGTTLNATLARIAPLLGAATFTGLIKGVIDGADAMHDLAIRTGISVEEIGAWKLVTDQSGTSIETLAKALDKGSKYIVQHGDKLKALGINATTSKELIFQLSAIMEKLPADDPRRAALAMEVLGKSAGDLLPLLSEGEKGLRMMVQRGQELNPITTELANNADKFKDELDALTLSSSRLGVSLTEALLPPLLDVTDSMLAASTAGQGFQGWLAALGNATGTTSLTEVASKLKELKKLRAELDPNKSIANKLNDWAFDDVSSLDKQIANAEKQKKVLEKIEDIRREGLRRSEAAQAIKLDPAVATKIDSVLGDQTGANAAKKMRDAARKDELDDFLFRDGLNKKSIEARRKVNAEVIQAFNDQIDLQHKEALEEAAVADQRFQTFTGLRDDLIHGNEDLNTALITNDKMRAEEQLRIENDRAVQRIEMMGLEAEEVQELLDQQAERYSLQMKELAQNSRNSIDLVKELGLTFTSSFESAISGGAELSDVLDGLGKDLLKLGARKYVTEPLLGGFDSLLSSIFPNADGNAFNSHGVMQFADGGVVDQATPFLFGDGGRLGVMGEAGPEAILPLARGPDGKLGVRSGSSGAGGLTVNGGIHVNVDVSGNSDILSGSPKAADLGRAIAGAVKNELIKQKRPGGLLA